MILETIRTMLGGTASPAEWEHGYKTNYVIATRYKNPRFGYNIGFFFPKHIHDCDRAETVSFIAANDGCVYQCGGYPGAEMFAVFKGVTDREAANKMLIEFLPKLDAHMRALR